MQTAPSWLFSPFAQTRWSTVFVAVAIFAIVSWRRHSPIVAIAAVLAWLSAYEIIFNGIGVAVFHWPQATPLWDTAATFGWVVVAALLGVWPDLRVAALFVASMVIWAGLGYHSNTPTRVPFNAVGEVLNESSKTLLGLAYLLGALRTKGEHVMEHIGREVALDQIG